PRPLAVRRDTRLGRRPRGYGGACAGAPRTDGSVLVRPVTAGGRRGSEPGRARGAIHPAGPRRPPAVTGRTRTLRWVRGNREQSPPSRRGRRPWCVSRGQALGVGRARGTWPPRGRCGRRPRLRRHTPRPRVTPAGGTSLPGFPAPR